MSESCLLALMVPPEARDELTDWLLAFHEELNFTSQPIDYHGTDPEELAGSEQVSGNQRRLLVRVRVDSDRLENLREELRKAFPGASWPYWVIPLRETGRLG